jgi:hypothetical protein
MNKKDRGRREQIQKKNSAPWDIQHRLRVIRNLLQHGHAFVTQNILSPFLTTWSKKALYNELVEKSSFIMTWSKKALYDFVEKDVEILRNTTADMDSVATEACFPDFD